MYVRRARLFLGIGLVLIPLGFVISFVQALLLGGFGLLGLDVTGEAAGATLLLVVGLGTLLALTGFAFVDSATARALVELDAGREIGVIRSYRLALERMRPLLGASPSPSPSGCSSRRRRSSPRSRSGWACDGCCSRRRFSSKASRASAGSDGAPSSSTAVAARRLARRDQRRARTPRRPVLRRPPDPASRKPRSHS